MFLFRRMITEGRSRIRAISVRLDGWLRDDSEARGLQLLREWLSPQQLRQFNTRGSFDVVGCDTGKRYRIYYGSSMNIDELDDLDRAQTSYCFVPQVPLVPGDVMIAQKIALETDECAALAVARRFQRHERPQILMGPTIRPSGEPTAQ
jgi:hypothetical protein